VPSPVSALQQQSVPAALTRKDYEAHRYGTVNVKSEHVTSTNPPDLTSRPGLANGRSARNISTRSQLGSIDVILNDSTTPTLIASALSLNPSYHPHMNQGGGPGIWATRGGCLKADVQNNFDAGDVLEISCSAQYYYDRVTFSQDDPNFIAQYQGPAIINGTHVVSVELLMDGAGVGHAFLYNYPASRWDLAYSNSRTLGGYAGTYIDQGAADQINGNCPYRPRFLHWATTIDDGAGNTHGLGLSDASASGPDPALTSCWPQSGTVSPYYKVTFPDADYYLWYTDQL
jgi:hypothetical protein